MRSTQDLRAELKVSDESTRSGVRRAREIGNSSPETVIAFSNEVGLGAGYRRRLKQRPNAEGSQPVTFCHAWKFQAPDGKRRKTYCGNTEGVGLFAPILGITECGGLP